MVRDNYIYNNVIHNHSVSITFLFPKVFERNWIFKRDKMREDVEILKNYSPYKLKEVWGRNGYDLLFLEVDSKIWEENWKSEGLLTLIREKDDNLLKLNGFYLKKL